MPKTPQTSLMRYLDAFIDVNNIEGLVTSLDTGAYSKGGNRIGGVTEEDIEFIKSLKPELETAAKHYSEYTKIVNDVREKAKAKSRSEYTSIDEAKRMQQLAGIVKTII